MEEDLAKRDVHIVLDNKWVQSTTIVWPSAKKSKVRQSFGSEKSQTLAVKGSSFKKTPRFGNKTPEEVIHIRRRKLLEEEAEKRRKRDEQEEIEYLHQQVQEIKLELEKKKKANMQAWTNHYAGVANSRSQIQSRRQDFVQHQALTTDGGPHFSEGTMTEFFRVSSPTEKRSPLQKLPQHPATKEMVHREIGRARFNFTMDIRKQENAVEGWMVLTVDFAKAIEEETNIFVEELVEDLSRATNVNVSRVGIEEICYLDFVEDNIMVEVKRKRKDNALSTANMDSARTTEDIYIKFWFNRSDRADEVSPLEAVSELIRQSKDPNSQLRTDSIHTIYTDVVGSGQAEAYLMIHEEIKRANERSNVRGSAKQKALTSDKSAVFVPTLTVARPFVFSSTKKLKSRTSIAQRRFNEYIRELKAEEQRLRNMKFRARPVPASTNTPRFKRMEEEQKEKKLFLKERLHAAVDPHRLAVEKAKEQTNDSSELRSHESEIPPRIVNMISEYTKKKAEEREREENARSRGETLQEKVLLARQRDIDNFLRLRMTGKHETDEERKARLECAAKRYLNEASLPPGLESRMIQRDLERKRKLQRKIEEQRKAKEKEEELKRTSKRKSGPGIVPNFQKLHEQNSKRKERLLQQKAAEKSTTNPTEFNLSKGRRKQIEDPPKPPKFVARKYTPPTRKPNFALTRSVVLKIRESRNRRVMAHLKKQEAKKQVELMLTPSDFIKTAVQNHVKVNGGKTQKMTILRRAEEGKDGMRQSDREYKAWIRDINRKLENRPLLMEQDKRTRDRLEARRNTLVSIKTSLESAGVTNLARYFNADELEDLGLEHWLEKKHSRRKTGRRKKLPKQPNEKTEEPSSPTSPLSLLKISRETAEATSSEAHPFRHAVSEQEPPPLDTKRHKSPPTEIDTASVTADPAVLSSMLNPTTKPGSHGRAAPKMETQFENMKKESLSKRDRVDERQEKVVELEITVPSEEGINGDVEHISSKRVQLGEEGRAGFHKDNAEESYKAKQSRKEEVGESHKDKAELRSHKDEPEVESQKFIQAKEGEIQKEGVEDDIDEGIELPAETSDYDYDDEFD